MKPFKLLLIHPLGVFCFFSYFYIIYFTDLSKEALDIEEKGGPKGKIIFILKKCLV